MPVARVTVLVLAVGGNVSQGILKALAHGKHRCRVLGADISAEQMGLYTVDHALVSPWAHDAEFVPWILDVCRRESVQLILSGAEPVLMELSRHRNRIERETGAACPVSEHRVMETGDDKWRTCEWLAAHGFRVPAYAVTEDGRALDILAARSGYPLVAKPRRGGGARGHFLVETPVDLAYARQRPGYLVQASVGTPDEEYTVGCFVDRHGALAPSCCIRRDLQCGTTVRATLGEFPDVRAEAEHIAAVLQPLGPCNVQLRMTEDGPVCFEINPRFSGTTPIRAHFGYNEADAVIDHFVRGEPVQLPKATSGVALRYWNEIYVDPAAVASLTATGDLRDPRQYGVSIETYGVPPPA